MRFELLVVLLLVVLLHFIEPFALGVPEGLNTYAHSAQAQPWKFCRLEYDW